VLDARFEKPCTCVVTIATPQIIVATPIGSARTQAVIGESFAIVEWGVGGATHRAEIDIGRGQSFVLTADAVRVWIVPDASGPAGVAPLKITATIAKCAGGGPALPPARSAAIKTIAAAASSPQQIVPPFARLWRLSFDYTAAWPWRLQWYQDQGATLLQTLTMVATGDRRVPQYGDWADVPLGADSFDVTNLNATDMQNVRVVFQLGLA